MYGYSTTANSTTNSTALSIDFSTVVEPEEEEEMALNVSPATGYTPAQAAKRLRVLLKQMLQSGSGYTNDAEYNHTHYKVAVQNQLDAIEVRLKAISGATRSEAVKNHVVMAQQNLHTAKVHLKSVVLPPKATVTEPYLKEAYSLVQVIPTIENAPKGSAENTIRAITAMIKVYWGVDSESTPEKLPSIMEELLLQVRGAQTMQPVQPQTEEVPA